MNQQALQLGFHFRTVLTLHRLTVTSRYLEGGGLLFLRSRPFRSKRLVSGFAESVWYTTCNKRENKTKGLMDDVVQSENGVMKDIAGTLGMFDVQSMQDDPTKVDKMTVEELRTTLRSIGIPAKGLKHDLVTTLKCFVNNRVDGTDDESIKSSKDYTSSVDKPSGIENENNLPKRKNISSESLSEKYNNEDDKTSGTKSSRKRGRKVSVEDGKTEVNAELVRTEQKLSIETEEVSGKRASQSKRIISSQTSVKEAATSSEAHLCTEPWTVLAHKKPKKEWIAYNPKTMRPPPPTDSKTVKLMSWNVNGIRALLKLEGFSALELAQREDFDVLCLQETKLQEKDVEAVKQCLIDGYENSFWTCSVSKLGYSGTAIISRMKPLSVKYGLGISDHDSEGRLVTVEFDSFYLISGYVPNSGDGLRRLTYRITEWDPSLSDHMKELEKTKPVILTGDLNCAHQEIDIFNPAGNTRSAGFTVEERQSFEKNFLSRGFVDTFRRQHPDVVGYTYWGYRHNGRKTNKGWRLDYFLVSGSIADKVHDSYILPDVLGSDHCPIGLILRL